MPLVPLPLLSSRPQSPRENSRPGTAYRSRSKSPEPDLGGQHGSLQPPALLLRSPSAQDKSQRHWPGRAFTDIDDICDVVVQTPSSSQSARVRERRLESAQSGIIQDRMLEIEVGEAIMAAMRAKMQFSEMKLEAKRETFRRGCSRQAHERCFAAEERWKKAEGWAQRAEQELIERHNAGLANQASCKPNMTTPRVAKLSELPSKIAKARMKATQRVCEFRKKESRKDSFEADLLSDRFGYRRTSSH